MKMQGVHYAKHKVSKCGYKIMMKNNIDKVIILKMEFKLSWKKTHVNSPIELNIQYGGEWEWTVRRKLIRLHRCKWSCWIRLSVQYILDEDNNRDERKMVKTKSKDEVSEYNLTTLQLHAKTQSSKSRSVGVAGVRSAAHRSITVRTSGFRR